MIHLTPEQRMLFMKVVSASRVTVIPIAGDALIAIVHGIGQGGPWCGFPTSVKAHPRVRPETAVTRLLARDLRCQHIGLRLVAVFDPEPGHLHREAVYTAAVDWPDGRPERPGVGRHRLQAITSLDQAREVGLRLGRLAEVVSGADLVAAARALPELSAHPSVRS